jgi:hypothetical protein
MSNIEDMRFALRTLARMHTVASRVDAETLALALLARDKNFSNIVDFILDVREYMEKHGAPPRQCAECGEPLDGRFGSYRADARYCSPKCRTRAYRKRTARTSNSNTDASHGDACDRADNTPSVRRLGAATP